MKYLKINNLNEFDSKHADYIVALSEYKPTISKWEKNKKHSIYHNLWYHLVDAHEADTFTEYYREKLGVIDEIEALAHINTFNQGNFEETSFSKIFEVDGYRYGVLLPEDFNGAVVVSTKRNDIPDVISYEAGSGGYRGGSFSNLKTFRDDLKNTFRLTDAKVDQFLKKYWE